MNGNNQEPINASGILATTSRELSIPADNPLKQEKNTEVRMIDYPAERPNGGRQSASRLATGPRTELGKQRSSRNAIKHGIFSQAILLKGESRAEFESLRTELWEALQPEGRLEELLVDKLASISWRYRRFLLAETGEIRKQFLEWNRERTEQNERTANCLYEEDRLIANIQDPDVLKRCLELLAELREGIETAGFQQERDTSILEKLYGANSYSGDGEYSVLERLYGANSSTRDRLTSEYCVWLNTAGASEEERVREGYATPEQCKQNVLDEIKDEIRRLKDRHKRKALLECHENEIELLRRTVPESPWLDRVLRYEASLERAFDRTLAQLERAQRLRLGQPVAPRVDVNISG